MEIETSATELEQLRYPTGRFSAPTSPFSTRERGELIDAIAAVPRELRRELTGLSDAQLDTPYRPGGWTLRQLAHHVPDSHLNAYTRFKLALTEDRPTIKPYDEARWAELPDSRELPIEPSLTMLEALHQRWVHLLRSLSPDDFRRELSHPDWPKPLSLDTMLALYAWHGRHHTGHVRALKERMGWS